MIFLTWVMYQFFGCAGNKYGVFVWGLLICSINVRVYPHRRIAGLCQDQGLDSCNLYMTNKCRLKVGPTYHGGADFLIIYFFAHYLII